MAGQSKVRAGQAFVEVVADDHKLTRGLRNASRKLKAFGGSIRNMGLKVAAVGGAIVGPLIAATLQFAKMGDQVEKMSKRTGIGTKLLSQLGFAAEQSGASIESLEKGIVGVGRFMLDLSLGLKTATDLLGVMGLSMADLENKTPDEKLELLLSAMGGIEDASIRTGVAMKVLGRSGKELLPLIGNFEELKKQAEEFKLGISEEDAKLAAQLTDAINLAKRAFKALAFAAGRTLAKPISVLAIKFAEIVVKIIALVDRNKTLVKSVAVLGAGVVVLGAALTAMGITAQIAGAALGGLAIIANATTASLVALRTVVASLAVFFSGPAGIIIGVGALGVAFGTLLKKLEPVQRFMEKIADTIHNLFNKPIEVKVSVEGTDKAAQFVLDRALKAGGLGGAQKPSKRRQPGQADPAIARADEERTARLENRNTIALIKRQQAEFRRRPGQIFIAERDALRKRQQEQRRELRERRTARVGRKEPEQLTIIEEVRARVDKKIEELKNLASDLPSLASRGTFNAKAIAGFLGTEGATERSAAKSADLIVNAVNAVRKEIKNSQPQFAS